MVYKTLLYIKRNLDQFLISNNHSPPIDPEGDGEPVILENIAKMEDANFSGNNKIILSLVNLEEESALKNRIPVKRNNGNTEYENPPVTFNAYLLFSSNITNYNVALQGLTKVLAFFQSKNYFSYAEDPPPEDIMLFEEDERENFMVSFDLYTLTFEQLNHLWGSLGGKQVPAVMYKVRIVSVKHDRVIEDGRVIERIRRDGTVD